MEKYPALVTYLALLGRRAFDLEYTFSQVSGSNAFPELLPLEVAGAWRRVYTFVRFLVFIQLKFQADVCIPPRSPVDFWMRRQWRKRYETIHLIASSVLPDVVCDLTWAVNHFIQFIRTRLAGVAISQPKTWEVRWIIMNKTSGKLSTDLTYDWSLIY